MKKIAISFSVLLIAACGMGIHAGDNNPFPHTMSIFEVWNTKGVTYYAPSRIEETVSDVRTVTENDIKVGVVSVVKAGELMAYSRTHETEFLTQDVLKANKDAVLSSSYSPLFIKKDAEYKGFGEVKIKGEPYMMVHENDDDTDVLLVNGDGKVYNRIGRIIKGRLALIDAPFMVEPYDVIFTPVSTLSSQAKEYTEGFELRYKGIEGNEMIFVNSVFGEECFDEEYAFELGQDQIQIGELTIEILSITPDNIEYKIL